MEAIYQKFAAQGDQFRSGFRKLGQAKNLEDLAHRFYQVLSENLRVEKIAILFKQSEKEDWDVLYPQGENGAELGKILTSSGKAGVFAVEHPEYTTAIKHALESAAEFGIFLGHRNDKSDLTEQEPAAVQFYMQQLDIAYQVLISRTKEKDLIFELNHRVLQLNSLIDTSIEITRLQESSQLLHLALERVLALTNASKGMLHIRAGSKVLKKIYFPSVFKSRQLEKQASHISASFSFGGEKYTFDLYEKESRHGHIDFDDTDKLLLDAFARQVHVSLQNRFLYEQSLEKERIDSEISLAGTIQQNLIPDKLPAIEGYDQHGVNIPTKHIGGDYYDCIPLKDGRFMFIMADVSGKGVAAGLLVSTLHASVHAYLDGEFELETLIQKLNEVVYDASTDEKYITAMFALLEPQSGVLRSVNAGHNPTYILRSDKTVEELRTGGIPLGMLRSAFPYESSEVVLNKGDSVLFYTDGVTEAMNKDNEEYDQVRSLKKFICCHDFTTAKNLIDDLLADMQDFTGNTPQSDDITAFFLARTGT